MILPKVSIIIPVYNGSNYLSDAINSALNQNYSNFEVLVINDGSTDNGKTESIAKSFGNKIRYFRKKNGGVSSALNVGIKKMTGEWFSWLSHDDKYYRNKLSAQMKIAIAHPEIKFIYAKHDYINEDGDIISKPSTWPMNPKVSLIWQLLYADYINGCTTLIHKDIFSILGVFNEQNITAQDYEMWLLIASNFQSAFCNRILVSSRQHQEMGTITMSEQNKMDTVNTIKRMSTGLSIEQIFPEILTYTGKDRHVLIAQKHNLLADMLVNHWHLSDASSYHYNLSKQHWNCLINPAFYKQNIFNWWYISLPFRNILNYYIWKIRRK